MRENKKTSMTYYFDPDIPRKSSNINGVIGNDEGGIPLPSLIEISVAGLCNRACSFCPHSDPNYPSVKAFIEPSLVKKIANGLNDIGFKGQILYSGFGEPLLDKKIFNHIATTRRILPNSRIELITNGDVLDEKRLQRLFESGLSTLLISVYDGEKEEVAFHELCTKSGLRDDQFVIRPRYLPPEDDFGITLTNRGGMMDDAEYAISSLNVYLKKPCFYPHYMMVIDYLGDALLCPHDWGKKMILGNLKKQSFQTIWTSERMNEIRSRLAKGKRTSQPCNTCDAKGTFMGKNHVKAWRQFNESFSSKDGIRK